MQNPAALLPELQRIILRAGEIALEARSTIEREIKPDGSIVTAGDRIVERFLRQELPALAPGAAILGEELGYGEEDGKGLWALDPIDGTSNYSFGSPLWGVSIGFIQDGEAVLGAVYIPQLNELYMGAKGVGATLNGEPLPHFHAGPVRPEELVSYPDRVMRTHKDLKIPGKQRHTGAVVVDAMFTASGRYRGLVGMREKLYDIAASIAICQELNAEIRYADGSPLLLSELSDNRRLEKPWIIFPPGSGFRM